MEPCAAAVLTRCCLPLHPPRPPPWRRCTTRPALQASPRRRRCLAPPCRRSRSLTPRSTRRCRRTHTCMRCRSSELCPPLLALSSLVYNRNAIEQVDYRMLMQTSLHLRCLASSSLKSTATAAPRRQLLLARRQRLTAAATPLLPHAATTRSTASGATASTAPGECKISVSISNNHSEGPWAC